MSCVHAISRDQRRKGSRLRKSDRYNIVVIISLDKTNSFKMVPWDTILAAFLGKGSIPLVAGAIVHPKLEPACGKYSSKGDVRRFAVVSLRTSSLEHFLPQNCHLRNP